MGNPLRPSAQQRKEPGKPSVRSERGQATFVVATMMMTFLMLFTFVVNTGMLVNAKINLQNAADLAAYAGAAVQARQLNHISFLNYEMRRQWKKFLFRYVVLSTMSQRSFQSGSSGPRKFSPDGSDSNDYRVPVVCMIFFNQDNFCQLPKLTGIIVPPANPLDSIQSTLSAQLRQIEQIRQEGCKNIGKTNFLVLSLWLFSTDPTADFGNASNFSEDVKRTIGAIRGMTTGLGIVPRLALLKARIKTLTRYVNFAPQRGLTATRASDLKNTGDVAMRERPIQAFFSAFHTLGDQTFSDPEKIVLDELLPPGGEGAGLLRLDPIEIGFDAYAQDFVDINTSNADTKDCAPRPIALSFKSKVPVGFKKAQDTTTYYALRLTADAKVLFNPFGNSVTLRAYSAAKPFGSRIGPLVADESWFTKEGHVQDPSNQPGIACATGDQTNCAMKIPALLGSGNDWYDLSVQGGVFQAMRDAVSTGSSGQVTSVGVDAMESAYRAAMLPNPFEAGKYNIPTDIGNDGFFTYFDNPNRQYAFWAPLFSSEGGGGNAEEVKQEIANLIGAASQGGQGGGTGNIGTPLDAIKAEMVDKLANYVNRIRSNPGDEGETFHIVRIRDPHNEAPPAGSPNPRPLSVGTAGFTLTDPAAIKSSWNTETDSNVALTGRTGYSVKFISFKSLMSEPNSIGAAADSILSDDLGSIKH